MPFNIPTKLMNLTLLTGAGSVALAGVAWAAWRQLPLPLSLALWHTAGTGLVVSLASTERFARRSTGLFGKREDGRIPPQRWVLAWPFLGAVALVVRGYRLLTAEEVATEVAPGWFLGGAPLRPSDLPPGPPPALLDVTCEMRRVVAAPAYKLLPSWETHGLSPEQIQEGVEWGLRQHAEGRSVLTYCTHGHGRSAVMACALLIAAGLVPGPEEARRLVSSKRPGAKPNKRQWEALGEWFAQHQGRAGGLGGGVS